MTTQRKPTVGVQAVVSRRREPRVILLGRRRGGFGDGTWALPGGHLEFGESFEDATRRELREETGIAAESLYVWKSINTAYATSHYVQIGVQVLDYRGEPENLEPERCSELRWVSLDGELPEPLFEPSKPFLELLQKRRGDAMCDRENGLSIYLHCIDPQENIDKYVTYFLVGDPPSVFVRSGRREEKRNRQFKVYSTESLNEALDLLEQQIAMRLARGYRLYDVRGNYDLEVVRSIFPRGTVAFRSVEASTDVNSRAGNQVSARRSEDNVLRRASANIMDIIEGIHSELRLFTPKD